MAEPLQSDARANEIEEEIARELRLIQSRFLEGAKPFVCLREAYDVCAKAYGNAPAALTEDVLVARIPARVFRAAVEHRWIRYPLVRPISGKVGFLHWPSNRLIRTRGSHEPIPDKELTEFLGDYKVTRECKDWLIGRALAGRIEYWRHEFHGSPKMETEANQGAVTASSRGEMNDRQAAVQAYIDEVRESGKRITGTDIWKRAGDKTRTEFDRWRSYYYEKRGKKTNRAANARFARILETKPHLMQEPPKK